jgi:hypothetical protein
MKSTFYSLFAFSVLFLALRFNSFAGIGDTTHVMTHNQQTMVTNPNTGNNPYKAWGVFPAAGNRLPKGYFKHQLQMPIGYGLRRVGLY